MRLLLLLLAAASAFAQSDENAFRRMQESKRQVTAYLVRRAQAVTDAAARELESRESWEKARPRRLEEMRDMLGLLPWPPRTPLNARVTATLDKGAYTVENIAFESLPKVYVTGNLYVPKNRARPSPAIIYVCGHAYTPQGDKVAYQRHGISFAKNGYVAFVLDSIQIAETFSLHHGVGWQEMYDWYSRGYTPAGVEVWNAMRAIDYLETRPEADASRIGITGRSGGAAMSWFTAAVDPRIKAAAPVMGISTYAANVRENTQRLHCDCMFVINSYLHDMLHQGALIAPRPLMMAHGRKDALFPVPGYEEFEQRVGALYRQMGAAAEFRNVVVDTGHQDSDTLREQAIRWFDIHMAGFGQRKLDMDYSNAPGEQLAVFGGSPPADAANLRVHEFFTAPPPVPEPRTAAEWDSRARYLTSDLKQKVFRGLPEFTGPPPAREPAGKVEGFDDSRLATEEGITVRVLFRRPKAEGRIPALLYVASDGEDPRSIQALLTNVNRRAAVACMAVYPRGVGEVPWDKSFWKDTLRNAMHTGLTVDEMRLTDVMRAFQSLRAEPGVDPDRIMLAGKGISGALGLYAAILDPRVHQVTLIDPPRGHVEGPIFLGVLRHIDLPEAAALLAPRHLNFYARLPAEYELTRRRYALRGDSAAVFVTMNLEAVAEGRYDHNFASGY